MAQIGVRTSGLEIRGEVEQMKNLAHAIDYAMSHGFEPCNAVTDAEYQIRYQLNIEDYDDEE